MTRFGGDCLTQPPSDQIDEFLTIDALVEAGFRRETAEKACKMAREKLGQIHKLIKDESAQDFSNNVSVLATALVIGALGDWTREHYLWAQLSLSLLARMEPKEEIGKVK